MVAIGWMFYTKCKFEGMNQLFNSSGWSRNLMVKIILLLVFVLLFSGCEDKYQKGYAEGYQRGYSEGASDTENRMNKEFDEKLSKQELDDLTTSYSVRSTEVCGGGGVNVNGKHYSGGKTGCVRVYSDGRIEKY